MGIFNHTEIDEAATLRLHNQIAQLTAERDEAYQLLETEHALTKQFRDLAQTQLAALTETRTALEFDVQQIGRLVASRISAVGMLSMCRQIMDGRSATSPLVAGALTVGFSIAKADEEAAKAHVDEEAENDAE